MKKQLASSLELSAHKRVMPDDIAHFLAMPSTNLQIVEDILTITYHDLDTNGNGMSNMLMNDAIGAAIEVYRYCISIHRYRATLIFAYRARSNLAENTCEKEDLIARYTTGHELCSFAACNKAWEELNDGGYDLGIL